MFPFLLTLLACRCTATPPEPPAQAPPPRSSVEAPPPAGVLGDLMGINEGVVVPWMLATDLPLERRSRMMAGSLRWLKWLGVRQLRVHSSTYPFLSQHGQQAFWQGDTEAADAYLIQVMEAGVEPLVMIGPWPGNRPTQVTQTCLPDDPRAYVQWVRDTVERYDGDGVADAPGLPHGVHLWEVDNEPDHHQLANPRVGDFCPPQDFSALVQLTATAIREADPQAVVLPGGLLRPLSDDGAAYGQQLWTQPGFGESVSGLNIHGYPDKAPGDLFRGVDRVAGSAPGEPLWITETSTRSQGRQETERSQASDLASIWLEAVRRGAVRVYWHSLAEKPTVHQNRRGPGTMTEGRHLLTGAVEDVEQNLGIQRFTSLRPKLSGYTLRGLQARYGSLERARTEEVEVSGGLGVRLGEEIAVYSLHPMRFAKVAQVSVPWEGAVNACPLVVEGESWPEGALLPEGNPVEVDLSAGPVVLRQEPCPSGEITIP